MRWRQRALAEIGQAKRTWFLTLTFSPVHLAGVLLKAKSSTLKDVERAAYREVQLYLKRLRKAAPLAKLRMLAVYERGEETGRSHYHLLVHEVGNRPVTKAILEAQWPSNSMPRLVVGDARGVASYLCKYLTKSLDVRPRASLAYGKQKPT